MAALTTELDAVNVVLGGVGQAPVTTLSGTLTGDTSRALATLRQVTSELQVKGWSFNTDLDFTLERDVSDNIPLPAATVSLTVNWANCSYDIDPVIRNGFLYDRKNRTDEFDVDVPVKRLTYLLDWDDTPEPFRVYAKYVARRKFRQRALGEEAVSQSDLTDESIARLALKEFELAVEQPTMLGSGDVRTICTRNWRAVTWG